MPTSDSQNSAWYVATSLEKSDRPRHPILGDDAGLLILPLAVAQLLYSGQDTVIVLDFGGGPANGMNKILAHLPNPDLARLRYVLVETPPMCQAMRERFAARPKEAGSIIEVTEAIPAGLPHPLIVHARSSIQYIPDYHALLSRLLALAPEIFIIAHTSFSDAPTYAQQSSITCTASSPDGYSIASSSLPKSKRQGIAFRSPLIMSCQLPIRKHPLPQATRAWSFTDWRIAHCQLPAPHRIGEPADLIPPRPVLMLPLRNNSQDRRRLRRAWLSTKSLFMRESSTSTNHAHLSFGIFRTLSNAARKRHSSREPRVLYRAVAVCGRCRLLRAERAPRRRWRIFRCDEPTKFELTLNLKRAKALDSQSRLYCSTALTS